MWYHRVIGGERCPIVDTWWQTETGAIMIAPFPASRRPSLGPAPSPLPGIEADIVDERGDPVRRAGRGRRTSSSQTLAVDAAHDLGRQRALPGTYWEKFHNRYYVAGDSAHRDKDGYFWIMGRIDDVLNVAGHRLGTMEIESALVAHPRVAEAAVVGKPHEIKGEVGVRLRRVSRGAARRADSERTRAGTARLGGRAARRDRQAG